MSNTLRVYYIDILIRENKRMVEDKNKIEYKNIDIDNKIKNEIERTDKGTFAKGISGNPSGRPKGSKNRTTLIRNAIEADMVDRLQHDALAVLNKTIELALAGDTTCIKILMDRLLPARKATDDNEKSIGSGGINIIVQNMSKNTETEVSGQIIDQKED